MKFLNFEFFSPHVNSTFALSLGEASVELTLTKAQKLSVHPFPGMMREPFSLFFRSSMPVVLPQRIYALRHEVLGPVSIFLVPLNHQDGITTYQAVFN